MALTQLCRLDQVSEGEPFQATIDGFEPFAVFQVGDDVFVLQDKCTHAGASLSLEGYVESQAVICGWHDGKFDLRTGKCLGGPCTEPVKAYSPVVKDGAVFVEL